MGGGKPVQVFLDFWLPPGYHFESDAQGDARYEYLLQSFFSNLSGSSWLGALAPYSFAQRRLVQNGPTPSQVVLGGSARDTTALPEKGTEKDPLTDGAVRAAVQRAVARNGWPVTINSIVYVVTPRGVQSCDSQSCSFGPIGSAYCAYHGDVLLSSTQDPIPYVNLPDVGCEVPVSPNHDDAADVAVSAAAHELAEAVTDPLPETPAWMGTDGELADMCEQLDPQVVLLRGHAFLLPLLWSNQVGRCVARL